ncbi:ribonuclease H-like domain-containing protein [Natronococcus sp.]|uniref:ribonuclease H-like domain-containing protein n=1 Tax=Natronococcus sp. TaxID=35747 RepID=UPI0025CE6B24|nr:ribonuclease H-like domain-containing protein [Natronococcus sp.]
MIGLTVLSEAASRRCTASQAADVVDRFDTDVLYVRSAERERFLREAVPDAIAVARYEPQSPTAEVLAADDGLSLVAATSFGELRAYASEQLSERTDSVTFVLSDLLAVSLDLTRLEAELVGLEKYREALGEANDRTVQLTTGATPSYRREWDGLVVQGVMPGASEQREDSSGVAHAELRPDGGVRTETRSLGTFGLEAVADVGPRRAETLRDEGFDTRAKLADTNPHDLARLEGIGRTTAQTIVESATVLETGSARVEPTASLPAPEPIFVDIETDGLDPSIVWLIGALDRSADSEYASFLETDPSRPERALGRFLRWLADADPGRPVVAYNGRNFDFPIIEEHVAEHCPEHANTWASVPKFDPYRWAVERNNAVLPGLTNTLEDVASALGRESDETGLTGEVVGRRYRRYAENPERELDWDRHERYCEDDVRALAFVYDRLEEADSLEREADGEQSEPNTSQGTLADFSR